LFFSFVKAPLKVSKTCYNNGNQGQQNIEECEDVMDFYVESFEKNHVKIQTIPCNHAS
jgi:hypothetical protein